MDLEQDASPQGVQAHLLLSDLTRWLERDAHGHHLLFPIASFPLPHGAARTSLHFTLQILPVPSPIAH